MSSTCSLVLRRRPQSTLISRTGQLGIVLNQWDEIPPLDNHELAIVDGDGICRSLPAIEKCNFPEQVAGDYQIKDRILALLGRSADSHGS